MRRNFFVTTVFFSLVYIAIAATQTLIEAPTTVTASYDESKDVVHIKWDAVPNISSYEITSYEVFRQCAEHIAVTDIDEVPATSNQTVYETVDLTPMTDCAYGVIAWTLDSQASSATYSNTITIVERAPVAPPPPEIISVDYVVASAAAILSWTAVESTNEYTVGEYLVYEKCEQSEKYIDNILAVSGATEHSFTYFQPVDGCQFGVQTISTEGVTSTIQYSDHFVTPSISVSPAAPSYVRAEYITADSGVMVEWPSVADANELLRKYTISRKCIGESFFDIATVVSDGSTVYDYLDDEVIGQNECQYAVQAQTDTTVSDKQLSSVVTIPGTEASTILEAPGAPDYVNAVYLDKEGKVEVTWPAVADRNERIAYYVIHRQCDLLGTIEQIKVSRDSSLTYVHHDSNTPTSDTCTYAVAAYTLYKEGLKTKSSPVVIAGVPFVPPPAPQEVKVEYSTGDALVFWQTVVSDEATIVEYKLYRQCPLKLPVVISVTPRATEIQKMSDPHTAEGCEYSVAAVSKEAGEGDQSVFVPIVFPETATPAESPSTESTTDPIESLPVEKSLVTSDPFLEAMKKPVVETSGKMAINIHLLSEVVVKKVEVWLRRTSSTNEEPLGSASINTISGEWMFRFDTTQKPDGEYLVYPKGVTSAGEIVIGEVMHILIGNDVLEPDVSKQTIDVESKDSIDTMAANIENEDSSLTEKVTNPEKESTDTTSELDEAQNKVVEDERLTSQRRVILEERVRADTFEDTDMDGISDFDEINIYNTNPHLVDTDGDGYGDGAEIVAGYNPLNKETEAIIEYEEVRNAGVIDPQMFAVNSVKVIKQEISRQAISHSSLSSAADPIGQTDGGSTTKSQEPETVVETTIGLQFDGVAPPNSFVTLYIYSTPIIVTVKTDPDGNWSYVLDKELEDGSHEVYVAMTDNAGQVYMKSNPLNFVKEAEAVTFDTPIVPESSKPSFLSQGYIILVIATVLVILVGAVIIIGMRPKRSFEGLEDIGSE